MVSTISLYDQFNYLYKEQQVSHEENDWLKTYRSKAFEAFSQQNFPTLKLEDWRFTNVQPFLKDEFVLKVEKPTNGYASKEVIPGLDAHTIVLQNGKLVTNADIKGLKLQRLKTALQEEKYAAYLGKHIPLHLQSFAALNTALFEDGILIEVEKNAVIEKPLHIVHIYDASRPSFIQPRTLIVANKSSKLDVVESIVVHGDENIFINNVTEVYVDENAQVSQYVIQSAPENTRLVNFTQAVQQTNSLYNNHTYCLPEASFIRNNLHTALAANNTETHLYGLYVATNNQLIDNHSFVDHQQPNCMSNELYKGVLMDNAKAVFNGKIFVHQAAQKTNAFQQNNNLLLSNKAVIDSKPQLEIFADDVKCSHGSTVGNFDDDALFYLKARGIGEESARNLLVNAFAFDVTNKIQIPAVRSYVEKLITDNLEHGYDQ
jgi:Fe-S cluster assembly protein SufD